MGHAQGARLGGEALTPTLILALALAQALTLTRTLTLTLTLTLTKVRGWVERRVLQLEGFADQIIIDAVCRWPYPYP